MEYDFLKGEVLLFDKPLGWTSFDVVNKTRWLIRRSLKIKKIKVGHAGTLDPLATGLLIICTGKKTKDVEQFMAKEKEYSGTLMLGATTPSYDGETEIKQTFPLQGLTKEVLLQAATMFVGNITQKPPIFSALKKEGRKLYELAREGRDIEIQARNISIKTFELIKVDLPYIDFRVVCSKGTYIRSLAHDFGAAVNNGAYLTALRRTKIGSYCVENALQIADFEQEIQEP